MSALAVGWVLGHSETQNALRMVLVVLAAAAADTGAGQIRLGTIGRQAGLPDKEKAETAVQLLAEGGQIELGERPRAQTVAYTVVYPGNDPESEWWKAHTEWRRASATEVAVSAA